MEEDRKTLDKDMMGLNKHEKFKKMYEKKLQSALMFYDYIVDQNDQLATLFLTDPFINTDLIEIRDKAHKYWNFFSQKQT